MLVHDSIDVQLPLEEIERQITRSTDLGVWAELACRRGEQLVVGPGGEIAPQIAVDLDIDEPIHGTDRTVFPISWRAAGPAWLFPNMDAELVLEAFDRERTLITFRGRYRPPLDRVGEILDRIALHRVSEATVRNFLERMVDALEDGDRSDAGSPDID